MLVIFLKVVVRCPHDILLACSRPVRWRTLARSSVNCVTAPQIICGTDNGSQETLQESLDVIRIWGNCMVDIGDGEVIAQSRFH